ncbi:hypothetical protein T439DRAFT_40821 [Meredithblackwellia eburnea MCA 4105]
MGNLIRARYSSPQGSKDATVPVAEEDATKSTTTEQPSKGKEVATTDKEDDEEQEEEIVDAQELLAQGVRSLALKKWDHACDQLSRAVEALTDKYGELAPEAGDAMILYGKALLNNAIAQGAVLGGAPGKAEETEEAVQNAVAGPSSGGAPVTAQSIQFHFGGDAEDDEEEEEEEEEGPGAGDKEDDLETAFLMLDMAKTIFSKIDKEEAKLKLGEAYRLLGDVATEGERFGEAVAEYTSALNVLASVHPPYHRSLSELHMLIALALDFVPNAVDRAVSHAEKAKSVLLLKLEQLEGLKEGERTEKDEREIKDIKELVGDVDMKVRSFHPCRSNRFPHSSYDDHDVSYFIIFSP